MARAKLPKVKEDPQFWIDPMQSLADANRPEVDPVFMGAGEFQPHQTVAPGGLDPNVGGRAINPFQYQAGAPAVAPMGFDQTMPGVAEQTFMNQQQRYMDPTMSSQAFAMMAPQLAAQGQGEAFYGQANPQLMQASQSEQLSQGPGLDPYYDRQRTQTVADMSDALSARGGFGSSAGTQQIGNALAGIGAEQANREAAYAAQVAQQADAAQLARLGLGGQLAGQADQAMLARMGLGGQMAGQVDQAELAQLGQMQQAAAQAQGLQRQRARDYIGDVGAATQGVTGMMGQGFGQLLGADQAMLQQALEAELARYSEALADDRYREEDFTKDIGTIGKIVGTIMNAKSGGMTGGGFGGFGG